MLPDQLSLAVLATAFAEFLGDPDAAANHCRYVFPRSCCRLNHDRVHVGYCSGIYDYSNFRHRSRSWNNSGHSHYGHGTHGDSYYGRDGQGYSC